MFSSSAIIKTQDNLRHDLFTHACTWIQCQTRLIWTLSSLISLISARQLLVESNFHYPILLYLAQLFTATIVAISQHSWHRQPQDADDEASWTRCMRRGWLMTISASCFTALSMACMLQAILHNQNMPTLIMLIAISSFTADFLSLLFDYASWSRAELFRVGLLLLSCIGILMAEYRLSVPSLISTIPAMVFAGIATALRRAAVQHYLKDMPSRKIEQLYFLSAGYVVGGIWTFLSWSDRYLLQAELRHVPIPLPLLAIYVIATASTLRNGRSNVFPVAEHVPEDELEGDDTICTGNKDAFTLSVLVGLTGCYSALSARRAYTNWVQYCCFAIAIVCTVYKSILNGKHSSIALPQDDHTAYELLDNLVSTESGGEESNDPDDVESGQRSPRRQQIRLPVGSQATFQIVVVLLLCIFSVVMNYSTFEYGSDTTSLDRDYKPAAPLEVVLSMYKEPVGDVWNFIAGLKSAPQTSDASVIIYSKDEDADAENLKLRTGADEVIMLPNIGREGETYLYHINSRWDTLAKHTIFLQADVRFSLAFYARLRNYFEADRTGFLNLGSADVCDCDTCGDQFFWHDNVGLFPQYHYEIYNTTECTNVLINYKGSFLVSAARIRGIKKKIYNELWQAFTDKDSWAHQPDFMQGRPDSMNAPDFGYTMERMWSLLFQCSDMDVAWRCPSPMSGWRIGGSIADCQCFDDGAPT